jgi:hypothetical protein
MFSRQQKSMEWRPLHRSHLCPACFANRQYSPPIPEGGHGASRSTCSASSPPYMEGKSVLNPGLNPNAEPLVGELAA